MEEKNEVQQKEKMSTAKIAALAALTALVVILTMLGGIIKFGPFSITLSLCPIIVGAAIFGPVTGAGLGFVFGLVVLLTGLAEWDGGGVIMMANANMGALILVCFLKAIAAGYVAGIVYKKFGIIAASVACPVTNTGIFIAGMFIFFKDLLASWSGGSNLLSYVILSLTGINFVIELVVNLVLATAVERIIVYARKKFAGK